MSRASAPSDLARFYAVEYPNVLDSLRWCVGDRELAEDLAQETFIRLCRHWEKVSEMSSPSAWLHRVAMNLAKSGFRRRAVRRRKRHLVDTPQDRTASDETASPVVHAALRDLDPSLRAIVVLRFCADLSVSDTADVLGIAEGTVKTRTRRALAELGSGGLTMDMEYVDG